MLMIWIAASLFIGFFAIGLAFRRFEGRFIYFPRDLPPGTLESLLQEEPECDAKFSVVTFATEDGETLTGWLGRPAHPRAWILWSHGNAGSIEHRWADFRRFVSECGFAVLLYDYRGYGRSTGSPDEAGLALDARAARDYLGSIGAPRERTFLLGRSLGGMVSIELASDRPPAGLVIESTFTSLADMAKAVVPLYPAHWFAKSRFPSEERIACLDLPILLLHGTEDELVPLRQGERLARAGRNVRFVPVEGAGHNDVSRTLGRRYFDLVVEFTEEILE